MNKIVQLLLKEGYTQAPWDKCPKGFEPDYPCYQHPDHNVWIQLYPKEKYGQIFYTAYPAGGRFETVEELKKVLPKKSKK